MSARLDDVAGRDLNVLSIDRYPTWFFLHLGGNGGLAGMQAGAPLRHLRPAWTAEDDRGGRYEGTLKSAHSGWPWVVDATLTPALAPEATSLALTFPHPFGTGAIEATVALPPV